MGSVVPYILSNILCVIDDYLQIRERRAMGPRVQHDFILLYIILKKEIRKD